MSARRLGRFTAGSGTLRIRWIAMLPSSVWTADCLFGSLDAARSAEEHSVKPVVTQIELSDAPEALRFLRTSIGRAPDSDCPPHQWLTWLGCASTVAGAEAPLGWKLTDQGRIVGVLFVAPFRNVDVRGHAFHDLVGHNYYVDECGRGLPAFALMQRFLSFKKKFRLKATTANAISGTLWRNLQGKAVAGSDVESYEARLSMALVAEAFYRKVPRLSRLFRYPPSIERGMLSARLDEAIRALGRMVTACGEDAIDAAASFADTLPRPRLDVTASLLGWVLANPWIPHRVFLVRDGPRSTAVVLAALGRGQRSQIATISIRAVWSEGGSIDVGALAAIHRACVRSADLVSYGCEVSGLALPAGTKQRTLDGHRRWLIASADKPGTDHWLGLDSV